MSEDVTPRLFERFSAAVSILMSHASGSARDELHALVARQAAELLDAEACALFLVGRGRHLALAARHGHLEDEPTDSLGELPFTDDPSESPCGYVAHQGEVFIANGELLDGHRAQPESAFLRVPSGEYRSLLCVPMRQGAGEVVGVLRLVNKMEAGGGPRYSGFNTEDVGLAQAYAVAAAAAVENVKRIERLEKLQLMAQAVAGVTTLREPGESLRSVVEATREALDCDAVTLYVYDSDRGEFDYPPVMAGVKQYDQVIALGRVTERSVVRQVLGLSGLYAAPDTPNDPLLGRGFARREGIKSAVAIPLRAADSPIGVMFINHRASHRFTQDELVSIDLFAQQATAAIYNVQLYERARRRARRLQMLNDAGRAITSSLDLREILGRIAEQACKLASYKSAQPSFADIRLVEGERALLAAARPREEQERIRSELGDSLEARVGIVGRALKTGSPQLVNEVLRDPDYISILDETRSQLVVPIKQEGKVIGTLNVEHPAANAFDGEAVRVLEALASQAAIAIENARQFEELKRAKTQVAAQTALALMGMASSTWGHATQGQAVTILGNAELLRRHVDKGGMDESTRSQTLKYIDRIERVSRRILDRPFMALNKLAGHDLELNQFLHEYLDRIGGYGPYEELEVKLEVDSDNPLRVNVAPEWLRQVLDILVENAAHAMSCAPRKTLNIRAAARDGAAEMYFKDSGPGIPSAVRSKLLNEPVRGAEAKAGSGMGLLIANTIVQAFDGRLWLAETGPRGTVFGISLPLAQ